MRVLHVNKFLYRRGGAEAYVFEVTDLQRAAGDDIELFGMDHPDNDACRFQRLFPAYMEFGELHVGGLSAKTRAAGRMVWSHSAATGIARVVDEWRPDVVHLHNIYHQLSPSILQPLRRRGIPMVMTLHDAKLACPTYLFLDKGDVCSACIAHRFWEAPLRRCANGSFTASAMAAVESTIHHVAGAYDPISRFICPSEFHASKMREARVYPDRLRVVPNFIDAARIPCKSRPGGPVVVVSRLAPEKGVDLVVRAAAQSGVQVEVAGSGPELASLEQLASELGVSDRVRFHGRLGRRETLSLLRAASVVAVPSRCYENQPMVVLEAYASGVPVVATTLGGLPAMVENDRTGLLVAPDDVDELASALGALAGNPDRAMWMGGAARRMAEERYSPLLHLDALRQVYEEAGADMNGHVATAIGASGIARRASTPRRVGAQLQARRSGDPHARRAAWFAALAMS